MNDSVIEIKDACFKHKQAESNSLTNVNLSISRGECVLICGESGSGKTTITRLINGLIPHYYEGELTGDISVLDMDIKKSELCKIAKHVGSVFQNPRSQFFCVDTTSELAFGCENMGLPEDEIRKRVQSVADEMNINHLLGRSIFDLSGGEKQKIACGSVSALLPDIFVLDEPTSNLDLKAIEDLKNTLKNWKDAGKTIVIAEHRLYWLKDICDRVICMENSAVRFDMSMDEFCKFTDEEFQNMGLRSIHETSQTPDPTPIKEDTDSMTLCNFNYSYDKEVALNIDELKLPARAIIAVTGLNGAGKSTFAKCLCGIQKHFKGTVLKDGKVLKRKDLLKKSYIVMQDVNHQLFCETVDEEIRLGMEDENEEAVNTVLNELNLTNLVNSHPMGISGGEKQRVAVASAATAGKEILVFDEPTSGLDYRNMVKTADLLSSLKDKHTILVITHDPALIEKCCTHILRLESGRVAEFGKMAD